MTDMAREWGRLAIEAMEAGGGDDALLYLTAFADLYTDTRTADVVDAVMGGNYVMAAALMRLQLAF